MIRSVPAKYNKLYEKACTGKSRKAAVRSQCLECMGYKDNEVTACTDGGCPLFNYRLKG